MQSSRAAAEATQQRKAFQLFTWKYDSKQAELQVQALQDALSNLTMQPGEPWKVECAVKISAESQKSRSKLSIAASSLGMKPQRDFRLCFVTFSDICDWILLCSRDDSESFLADQVMCAESSIATIIHRCHELGTRQGFLVSGNRYGARTRAPAYSIQHPNAQVSLA
jgi:hypothetical protein